MSQLARIRHLLHEAVFVFLRPYWKLYGFVALAVVALVLFEICFPLTIKYLIDRALIPQDRGRLIEALLTLTLLFAVSAVARFFLAVSWAYVASELGADLIILLLRRVQRLPMGYFDQAQSGQFATLFDTELLTLLRTLHGLVANGLRALLQLVAIMVTLFVLDWELALVVMLLLPLVVLRPQRFLNLSLEAMDRSRKFAERLTGAVQDYVSTQAMARAFGRADAVSRRFIADVVGRKHEDVRGTLRTRADLRQVLASGNFLSQTFKLSMNNQQAGITLLVIVAGAGLNFFGMASLGTFSAFILFLPKVMGAVTHLADYVKDLGRAALSLDRIEAVRDAAEPAPAAVTPVSPGVAQQAIRFEQISFSYTSDKPYIQNVNLTLPIGQSVAIVGRSGAGKSTLFRLLLGFYRPTAGSVEIDGYDIRTIDPAALGAQFGTVLQQALLANTTVRENIRFARPAATDEEVMHAARLAGIHEFVVALPKGYDSAVGEGGKWFSEGQRQRIALARAILPRPAVLLLDEVTSSLDPETETAINATIQQLAKERTVMMVTHRLASASFVDHIVVMDQGQVKEEGRHEELLARGGLYYQLWQMQTGFVVSGDGQYAEVSGERLQAIPLFRDVGVDTLAALASRFVSRFYQAGQPVYAEGEAGDKFYIVVRGTVSISTLDAEGQTIRLAELQDGDYFGEVEMVNKGRRTTTVRAATPSLVLALYAEHFDRMVGELGSLSKVVTQMALGRSLSTICSVGRRRRSNAIWRELIPTATN